MMLACLTAAIALLVGIIKTWRDLIRGKPWQDDNGKR
jgi:hypothetical protein